MHIYIAHIYNTLIRVCIYKVCISIYIPSQVIFPYTQEVNMLYIQMGKVIQVETVKKIFKSMGPAVSYI